MNRPRLGPEEGALWDDFLRVHGSLYTDYEYDVQVIPGGDALTAARGKYRGNWEALTCPRADVVAKDFALRIVLFEVRPMANADALLRLIGYAQLMQQVEELPDKINLAIVCRDINPMTRALSDYCDVTIFAVSPSDPKAAITR